MKTLKGSVAFVLAIGLFLPAIAFAQADARFAGVVLDPSGAVVPGATVLVKNERTGEERTVVTNTEGRYIVANLRPSVYTIRATFGQLAPLQFDGLQLVAGQEFPLDLTLQAAGVTETVTVQAQVSTIDLSSASIGVQHFNKLNNTAFTIKGFSIVRSIFFLFTQIGEDDAYATIEKR